MIWKREFINAYTVEQDQESDAAQWSRLEKKNYHKLLKYHVLNVWQVLSWQVLWNMFWGCRSCFEHITKLLLFIHFKTLSLVILNECLSKQCWIIRLKYVRPKNGVIVSNQSIMKVEIFLRTSVIIRDVFRNGHPNGIPRWVLFKPCII